MTVHCKKCEDRPSFRSLSKLRIHQWSAHREAYENNGFGQSKGWSKKQHAKYKATIEARRNDDTALIVRPIAPSINAPEMSARELLAKLKNQATFMTDVVNLVEGLIK